MQPPRLAKALMSLLLSMHQRLRLPDLDLRGARAREANEAEGELRAYLGFA